MNLRAWLRKDPKPSKLRVDGKDVAIIDGKWKWAEAERSIQAMDGEKIEALDSSGGVLRACVLGDGETVEDPKATTAKESELVLIARELRIAADESAARHEGAYKYAFDSVVSMFNAQSNRLGSLEGAWQKLVMAGAQGDEHSLEGLIGSMMNARAQGAAETERANGKKK